MTNFFFFFFYFDLFVSSTKLILGLLKWRMVPPETIIEPFINETKKLVENYLEPTDLYVFLDSLTLTLSQINV